MNLKLSVITLAISSTLLTTTAQAGDNQTNKAFDQLSTQAISKIRNANIDVNALISNESNDLIVHFDQQAYAKTQMSKENVAPRTYKLVKEAVLGKLSEKTTLMRDYYASPTSFVRIQSKDDLVKLLNDPNVTSIVHNHILTTNLKDSLSFIKQPQAAKVSFKPKDADESSKFNGEGSVIAILDTGLDPYHDDFGDCSDGINTSGCKVAKILEIAEEKDGDTDGKYDDGSHHGSNVSAIAGAVAPKAKIVALDVFSWSYDPKREKKVHTAPYSSVNAGLNWVKNNHIENNPKGYNFVSANLSLGSSVSNRKATNEMPVISSLKKLHIASVVASGNDGFTKGIGWPASEKDAVAVGAVYDADYPYEDMDCLKNSQEGLYEDEVACFSNSGSLLQLLAPGYDIDAGGYTMTGTSQAAPHVAGAIAVLQAPAVIEATNDSISSTIYRLKKTGERVTDYRNGLIRSRINLLAAVKKIAKDNPES